MKDNKRQAAEPVDAVNIADSYGGASGMIVGIEPSDEHSGYEVLS
jgi:hypothetical protein